MIIEKNICEKEIIPAVRTLKTKIFGHSDIVLHEAEIRSAKDEYRMMSVAETRNAFWDGLRDVFSSFQMTSIGAAINIQEYQSYYHEKDLNDEYFIVLQIVLENFVHFLGKNNGKGQVYIEGINVTDDLKLQNTYHKIVANGTLYYHQYAFQERLLNINFMIKGSSL